MSALRAACALLAISLGTIGCTTAPTQLIVRVDSDIPTDVEPPVEGDRALRAVRVTVCEPSCDRVGAARVERQWAVSRAESRDSGRVRLPFSFGVAPSDPASPGRVEIRVEALRLARDGASAGDVLFATRRVAAFALGRKLEVPIFLPAGCLGAACPVGTTCDDEGECVGIDLVDAGSYEADAAAPDAAGRDVGAIPGLDASVDAATSPVDAGADPGMDAGLDVGCTLPAAEPFPASLVAESQEGFNGGWITATANGEAGASLATGVFASSTTFSWGGATAMGPAHFVSRVGSTTRWTTFARVVGTYLTSSRLRRVAEAGGTVYAAGTTVEGWSISGDGATLTLPPMPADDTEALRAGVVVLALDAGTGRPRWARTLTTSGAGDYLAGLVADAEGVTIAWRSLPSATSTLGGLSVDGVTRRIDRGPADGRLRIARLDPLGTVLWVHAIGGATFAYVDLVRGEGTDQLLSMHVSGYLPGHTALDGILPAPPEAELVVARLDVLGDPRWSTGVRCTDGAWAPQSGAITAANGRVFTAFAATTPSTASECRTLEVGHGAASDPSVTRTETGATWVGLLGLEACSGRLATPSLLSFGVNGTPAARVEGIVADARSVALTGYAGAGGFVTSSGTVAGRDPGTGTDGFLMVFTPLLERRFALVFGSRTTVIGGADDYGAALGLVDTSLYLALGLTAPQTVDGVTIPSGARLVRFALR